MHNPFTVVFSISSYSDWPFDGSTLVFYLCTFKEPIWDFEKSQVQSGRLRERERFIQKWTVFGQIERSFERNWTVQGDSGRFFEPNWTVMGQSERPIVLKWTLRMNQTSTLEDCPL